MKVERERLVGIKKGAAPSKEEVLAMASELLAIREDEQMLVEREKAAREADDAGEYDVATLIRMGR